ncbi:WD40-repeat-containing domain protein [Polychytrium aggregatum]|uniref:WD40-repeat-containing domain protein n=1 Tax=Polychytrium aggregatum TaxID=110093 RepID=UPI0022FE7350|nr:WD40-repeat-containing domain protein [Polychytrium aggregatum]KAI9190755.1 WD40-repeat-containing domain protein [Polychytrium aggregatum]
MLDQSRLLSIKSVVTEQNQLSGRALSTHSLKSDRGEGATEAPSGAGADDWLPPKVLLKPPGQLQLTEKELEEEFTRILNANNPHAPQNIARYNHKESIFKVSPNVDHLVTHLEFDGYLVYKNADEAQGVTLASLASGENGEKTEEGTNPENPPAEGGEAPQPATADGDKKPKGLLRNQFNFSERASQTTNNPFRERATNTEPPPARTFSDTVNQWSIYDAYMDDLQQKEKALKDKSKVLMRLLASENHGEDVYFKNQELRKAFTIVERMANQNTFDDISQDYKYWEDASDELGDRKSGTLLPLWTFICEKDKKKQVTTLCWNPANPDLFAVGYGSYDFCKQGPGIIACFTLKNPSYPEYLYVTESGVMCLDFHPQHPSMIAVGLYDGTVSVFNMQKKMDSPIYKSNSKGGKHTDPVWQVCWQKDDLDDNANFFSISSDGRVTQWTLLKSELMHTDIIALRYDLSEPVVEPPNPESIVFNLAGGFCFDFHKTVDHLFVVGTEEGKIHKCSKSYNNQYLLSFEGHQMAVYTVRYNRFHPSVFLSASADWTVKLWDHDQEKPVLTFDLNSSVGDVAWAPYSSTVFAAATSDGKERDKRFISSRPAETTIELTFDSSPTQVYVFDLNENKYQPICEQQVARKAKLTHISFNPFEPILLVGDDHGTVISLKLSPNLRKTTQGTGNEDEKGKLDSILAIAMGKIALQLV